MGKHCSCSWFFSRKQCISVGLAKKILSFEFKDIIHLLDLLFWRTYCDDAWCVSLFKWKLLVIFHRRNGMWKDNLCFESFLWCLCYFGGQTYLPLCGGSRQNIGVKTAAAPPPDLERGSFGEEPQNLWDKAFVFKSFCSVYVYYTIYFYILILLICKPCNGNCFLLKPLICPLFDT